MFSEIGRLDWEVLLEPRREYELAIISGVFDDELASIQRPQLKRKREDVEDYFASMKPLYNRLFQSGRERVDTLEELVSMARSMGVFQQNVRYWCESILGREIDWQYAERFGRAFPPIRATIYAFLIGHFHRNNSRTSPGRAGAIDLQAAAYLVLCHKFVTDDRDQQRVLRDVVKYCSFKTDVSWFSGDFSKRFSDCV